MMETSDRLVSQLIHLGTRLQWPLSELLDLDHPTRRILMNELERVDG